MAGMLTAQWVLPMAGETLPDRDLIGGKAWSLANMRALGLPVPPAFVITTQACHAYLESGGLPSGLMAEVRQGVAWLEQQTGRGFGSDTSPLLVSVRSGAAVSMPGMMDTVLNLGINTQTAAALATESNNADFARDTFRRFHEMYADIVLRTGAPAFPPGDDIDTMRAKMASGASSPAPEDPMEQLEQAITAVFESWNSRRARRYRKHHAISDELGTAVTVQAMVFGNLNDSSGTGVLFTRNPLTGERLPYGEYLSSAQGEDVVSGKLTPGTLDDMRATGPRGLQATYRSGRDPGKTA